MRLNSFILSLPNWSKPAIKSILKIFNTIRYSLGQKSLKTKNHTLKNTIKDYNFNRPLGPQKRICNAPFSSLYFGSHGEITACCFNRQYILGNYPQNTIKEIWEGQQNLKLKESLLKHDFSLGCNMCEQTLLARNFEGVGAVTYDMAFVHEKYPTSLKFELSNICNLSCIMCNEKYSSSFTHSKVINETFYDDTFLEQIDEFIPRLHTASFLGGEPFLIKIYYKIWNRILKLNPSCIINLQTNGSILNDKIKLLLDKGNFHISISVDSLQKNNYEFIRNNASFDEVMKNLIYFAEYANTKNAYFGISFCPMQVNWKEIPDIVEFCNMHHAKLFFNYVVTPSHLTLKTMNVTQLKEIREYLNNYKSTNKTKIAKHNRNQFISLQNQINSWYLTTQKFDNAFEKVKNIHIHDLLDEFAAQLEKDIQNDSNISQDIKAVKLNRVLSIKRLLKTKLKNNEFARLKIFQLKSSSSEDILKGMDNKTDEEIILELQ